MAPLLSTTGQSHESFQNTTRCKQATIFPDEKPLPLFADGYLHINFKPLAVFSRKEGICLRVTDDFSLDRVPLYFATQSHRNVRNVTDFEHSVV